MVEVIEVEPIITTEEAKKMEGTYIPASYYLRVITSDADVYWNDNGTRRILLHFRKKAIPDEMMNNSIRVFKKEAMKASSLRGVAGGVAEPAKISPNVDHIVSTKGKFRTQVAFKDGSISNYYLSNKVNSIIAGYFDKPKVSDKHDVLRKGLVPCRTTVFTEKHTKDWESVLPMLKLVDGLYRNMEPATHKAQLALAERTPEFRITDTAFSTLTVNLNWRTAVHIDGGDFKNGYSVIMVAEEGRGKFKGGFLGYPRFGVCVDVRHGDFLLMDPHQHHANTEIIPVKKDYTRLSFVVYYRENIQKCALQPKTGGAPKIPITIKRRNNPELVLTPVVFPKRGVNLQVYTRPNTTDIKVIDEVLKQDVYEKKFPIEPTDNWLDLGGNIGTFALLALVRGAHVTTCEPEEDNLRMLNMNLNQNFKKDSKWTVVPAAITTDTTSTVSLYICKGDYNKYRHTVFPKRGRSTVSVKNMNIHDLLSNGKFNAIKMDIEGAEIQILEHLTESDYVKYGIYKLVFEYSFDVDDSIPRFMNIIRRLQKVFPMVHFTKVKPDELHYTYFPAATLVYCSRN